MKNEKGTIVLAGGVIGLIAAILVFFGNPANMGFCIACFLRDTTGALGLHSAAAVQYIRPEIIGLVLGACIISLAKKEFRPRGGSAPVTRFTLGAFVMIGCLMFLGCPFRMILRLAGAVRRLASSAFSSRFERTRHRLISSTGRHSGRSSCTENGICSRFASAQ